MKASHRKFEAFKQNSFERTQLFDKLDIKKETKPVCKTCKPYSSYEDSREILVS